jgi:L-alanine-DL-glutamate epimerase-like enolase superfamily enzyme
MLNIKLMKSGGIYQGSKINETAKMFNVNCMIGCMFETRIALATGLSLAAASDNLTDTDCDSLLFYDDSKTGIVRSQRERRIIRRLPTPAKKGRIPPLTPRVPDSQRRSIAIILRSYTQRQH